MNDSTTDVQRDKSETTTPLTRQSRFGTDVLKLASGTTLAQIINILASPVLARLFAPEAFGIFALFVSITGILAAVVTLQYELSIMLPKDDSDAANLLAGTLGIATFLSLATVPLVWLFGPTLAGWLNAPHLASYLWLLPIVLLFGGIGAGHPVLNSWSSRTRHFAQISATQVVSTLSSTFATLGAGFFGVMSGGGLIGGNLVGSMLSPLLLGRRIWKQDRELFRSNIRWERIRENLARYRKFPLYSTPSALLNTISWQVPSFLLAAFFSPAIVGYYSFGNQLLRMPMNLIGGSIAQAFYSHASTAHQNGTLAEFVEETFRRLVNYSFFPILILAVIGRELFSAVFGADWAEAGVYTQILSVWMVFWFISSPMARLFSVLERNEFSFGINVVILITRIISVWWGGVLGNPRFALMLFSISGALVYGFLSVYIMIVSGVSWRRILAPILENILLFFGAGAILFLVKMFFPLDWIVTIIAGLLVCGYFLYRFGKEPSFQKFLGSVKRTFQR